MVTILVTSITSKVIYCLPSTQHNFSHSLIHILHISQISYHLYCLDYSQSNQQIQCKPFQNPNDIFPSSSNVKAHSQIHMELQGTLNTSKNP